MRRLDDIAVLEHAYDLTATPEGWLDGLHERFGRRLDLGLGVSIGTWAVAGANCEFVEQSPVRGDAHPSVQAAMAELVGQMSTPERVAFYGPHAIDFIGSARDFGMAPAMSALCAKHGVEAIDGIGMLVLARPASSGLVLFSLSAKPVALYSTERRRLRRIGTHLSAGFRLRETLRQRHQLPSAVLSPSGQLLHAEGDASEAPARRALALAVKNIEASRGKLRRTSPEEAMMMWKGLVAGKWTIVDWVDTDSRRFLVAHENPFSTRALRALSPREVDIAEHLAQGRSTSEIGYALGLQSGTVSRAARTVLRKLGVKGRADLAALFGGVAPLRANLPVGDGVFALTPGPHPNLWSRLTPAERQVVEGALRGRRLAQVASARKVSVKTVKNQLGAVYARFGVRGRSELATLLGGVPIER